MEIFSPSKTFNVSFPYITPTWALTLPAGGCSNPATAHFGTPERLRQFKTCL